MNLQVISTRRDEDGTLTKVSFLKVSGTTETDRETNLSFFDIKKWDTSSLKVILDQFDESALLIIEEKISVLNLFDILKQARSQSSAKQDYIPDKFILLPSLLPEFLLTYPKKLIDYSKILSIFPSFQKYQSMLQNDYKAEIDLKLFAFILALINSGFIFKSNMNQQFSSNFLDLSVKQSAIFRIQNLIPMQQQNQRISPLNLTIAQKQLLQFSQTEIQKSKSINTESQQPAVINDKNQIIIDKNNLEERSYKIIEKLNSTGVININVLFVIDFECNQPHDEIIEFPIVVVDLKKLRVIDQFHSYVRPLLTPRLNPYISRLTGITQSKLNDSPYFKDVIKSVNSFIQRHVTQAGGEEFCSVLYDCDNDCKFLKNQLLIPEQNIILTTDVLFTYCNLRSIFPKQLTGGVQCQSLGHAQDLLELKFEGRKHSGIDDAKNIARVVVAMAKKGYSFNSRMKESQFIKQEKKAEASNLNLILHNQNVVFMRILVADSSQKEPALFPIGISSFVCVKNSEGQIVRRQGSEFQFQFGDSKSFPDSTLISTFYYQFQEMLRRINAGKRNSVVVVLGQARKETGQLIKSVSLAAKTKMFYLEEIFQKHKFVHFTEDFAEFYRMNNCFIKKKVNNDRLDGSYKRKKPSVLTEDESTEELHPLREFSPSEFDEMNIRFPLLSDDAFPIRLYNSILLNNNILLEYDALKYNREYS